MQEISANIYIETGYPGVTLGAISLEHGLIMIDAPFRQDDIRAWKASILNLCGGVERLLINLDGNFDRTIGARAMDCTIVGHERMAADFRTRPISIKSQSGETGAGWESSNGVGNIRWAPPEITFSQNLTIYWDKDPLKIEFHPGPANGACWVSLPERQVVFVGDAVVPDQPPFFATADLPLWIEALSLLFTPEYRNFLVVSGRGDLVTEEQIKNQAEFIKNVHQLLEELAADKAEPEKTEILIPDLVRHFSTPTGQDAQFLQRLKWGLYHYYDHHYKAVLSDKERMS